MHTFIVTMQEVVEHLKKKIGIIKTVALFKEAVKKTNLEIKITDNGVITAEESMNNEENYLKLFKMLREGTKKLIGAKKTRELFKNASKQVIKLF